MIKQEEIREGIDTYTDDSCLYPNVDCELRSGGYCVSTDDAYKCLMKRLAEIGVVIKVERESPTIPELEERLPSSKKNEPQIEIQWAFKYGEQKGFRDCKRKFKEAGCGFFEPIKATGKEA